MKISFIVNPVFNGWAPTDTRLGGTEEAVVQWAEQFADFGHEVTVYQNGFEGHHGLVRYLPRDQALTSQFDATINVKSPDMASTSNTWYLTNETDAGQRDLSLFKGVIWPSQWARDHIKVNNSNVQIIPYGYDPDKIYPAAKTPKQVLYASSPDRGLQTLLDVWPKVLRVHPDAVLIVTYGAQPQSVSNVLFLGDVSEASMNELYQTSDIWCHPCNGGELFGITGLKAQAAGCVPVVFPTMALRETVKSGIFTSPSMLADDLSRMLGDETRKEAVRQDLASRDWPTWQSTARQLLETISVNGIVRP